MNIDFSKFKKVDGDDKYTVLQHPGGHTVKIAHKGLSPEVRKELEQLPTHMAKGGRAKYSQMFDPNIKGSKASKPSGAGDTMPGSPKMAEKAYTEPQDAGPDVALAALHREAPPLGALGTAEKQHYPPCINPSCKSFGKSHPNCRCYGGNPEPGHFAKGGKVDEQYYCDDNRMHRKECEYYKDGGEVKGVHKPEMEDVSREDEKKYPQSAKKWMGQSEAGAAIERSDIRPDSKEKALAKHAKVIAELKAMPKPKIQGFKAGGMAEGEEGAPVEDTPSVNLTQQDINPNSEIGGSQTAEAPQEESPKFMPPDPGSDIDKEISDADNAAGPVDQPVQTFQQHKQNDMNQLSQESQMFQNDVDAGHIKPETYSDLFAKKDTLGKVGTLFGMLLSGAGSGLSHQPNMLMEMMNKQIDNDLRAQQESVGNKQNYLRINQQNLLNQANAKNITAEAQTKAYALAKTQMNYAALHKLVSDTQKLPDGPQKQQAMQTLAMMNQGVQNENFNILDRAATGAAFYKTLFGEQRGNQTEQEFQQKQQGLQALGPQGEKISEFQQERHYPGIPGQASNPLTNEDRGQIHSGITFDRTLNDFRQWAKTHSGDLSLSDINYGQALAADVQGAYRQATHGGVYKEGEANFISSIIDSSPTKFFNSIRVVPKLDAAAAQNKLRLDQILKDKGFQGYPGLQQKNATNALEGRTVTGKDGHKMIMKNGKWKMAGIK